jgi:tRNA (guanine-N7-)-methyltransferase
LGHRKLRKFAEVATFSNVFQPNGPVEPGISFPFKGKWNEHFKNNNPIVLELGCGRGEYTVGLAKRFPNHNFIGMDVKGARIWKGAKAALQEKLNNVAFVRNRIDFVEAYFDKEEVSEIWIPFPDPFPKKENKRLVALPFIERYRNIAPKDATVHLKTDNEELYAFALEQVDEHKYKLKVSSDNVYEDAKKLGPEKYALLTEIQTYYEKHFMAMGKKINYVEFTI